MRKLKNARSRSVVFRVVKGAKFLDALQTGNSFRRERMGCYIREEIQPVLSKQF